MKQRREINRTSSENPDKSQEFLTEESEKSVESEITTDPEIMDDLREAEQETREEVLGELGRKFSDLRQVREAPRLFESFNNRKKSGNKKIEKKPLRKMFSAVNEAVVRFLYKNFPEVADGNNPDSENFYLKKVDAFNQQQEEKAETYKFDKRIAFFGHMHSKGEDDWRSGSDGSMTVLEMADEYQKATETLKQEGFDEVFAVITDHNAIANSIEFGKVAQERGLAKPIYGAEIAVKEGYELLVYTSEPEKLKAFYEETLEPKLGKVLRYAKSGVPGKELMDQLADQEFVLGISHPAAAKAIIWGGTMKERFQKDPELMDAMSKKCAFYEGMNWFQNVKGSNCIAFGMQEQMKGLGIEAFANSDFHSKVKGQEGFFGGMFTEIRTGQEIQTGADFLQLLRRQKEAPSDHPEYVSILRGLPADESQYKDHLNNATGRTLRNIAKAVFGVK